MTRFDVFNGDADGICALQQLRLAAPAESVLVTGPKRDVTLLARVPAMRGDAVTVLDVSLDANRAALDLLLARRADIDYFDHHFLGDVPDHPRLHAHIDTAQDVCTSVIVDRYLAGRQRLWAVVGAYGDNLVQVAGRLAAECGLTDVDAYRLQALDEALNYNGYGDLPDDLFMAPLAVYLTLRRVRTRSISQCRRWRAVSTPTGSAISRVRNGSVPPSCCRGPTSISFPMPVGRAGCAASSLAASHAARRREPTRC